MHIVTRNDIILLSKPNIFQLVYQFLSKPVVTTTSPPKFHRTLCTTHTPSPFTAWPLLDCPKDHEGHWQRRGQRIDWDSKNNHRPEGIPWQRCQLLRAEKPCGRNDHKGHVIKKRGNHVSQRYLGWGYVTIPRKVLIFDHIRILHAYSPLIYCSDSGRSIYIYIYYIQYVLPQVYKYQIGFIIIFWKDPANFQTLREKSPHVPGRLDPSLIDPRGW